jgi:hypothetical protein
MKADRTLSASGFRSLSAFSNFVYVTNLKKSVHATLEATGTSLRWVIARVPIDLKKAWRTWKSRRVFGEINGFAFRTALIPGIRGEGFTLIVNKKMQAGARVRAADRALIKLRPDLGELVIDMPVEFARILKADRALKKWFDGKSTGTSFTF